MNKALKPNQIRAFSNSQGNRSYYLIVQDGKGKLGAMWFRHRDGSPLHISWKFKMEEEHDLIMEDCNKLRTVFGKMDSELYGDDDTITRISLTVHDQEKLSSKVITSIKYLRAATGDGLKETKAVIDMIKDGIARQANISVKMSVENFDTLVDDMNDIGISVTGH